MVLTSLTVYALTTFLLLQSFNLISAYPSLSHSLRIPTSTVAKGSYLDPAHRSHIRPPVLSAKTIGVLIAVLSLPIILITLVSLLHTMGFFNRLFKKHSNISFSVSRGTRTTTDPEAIEAFRQRQRARRAAVIRNEVVEAEGDLELPTYEAKGRDSRCIVMPVYTENGDILRPDLLPDAEPEQPPHWTAEDGERLLSSGEAQEEETPETQEAQEIQDIQEMEQPPVWTRMRMSVEARAPNRGFEETEEQSAGFIDRSGCA